MSRIAITGGTGFVGRHLARWLMGEGHEVVVISRGVDRRDPTLAGLPGARVVAIGLGDPAALERAIDGCVAVVHCAGINREIGGQTFEAVHVQGTRNLVAAATRAGVERVALLGFLRARPDGPSAYHRTKWAAEEIVRGSGLDWTVLKAGVIYGRGDHLLDHLSRALLTVPVFGRVGFRERLIRPVAVDDVVELLAAAALGDPRLSRRTLAVLGPETLSLDEAVLRIGSVIGRRPLLVPLPVWVHRLLAVAFEASMAVPLVARAQVEILVEGGLEPLPFAEPPPVDLAPRTPFSAEVIRAGLPAPSRFGRADCRCRLRSSGTGGG